MNTNYEIRVAIYKTIKLYIVLCLFIVCLSSQFHKQGFDTLLLGTGRVAEKSGNVTTKCTTYSP